MSQAYEIKFTARELQIIELICLGDSNKQIAFKLGISQRTVENHRLAIIEKSRCRNTAHLVYWYATFQDKKI